MSVQPWRLCVQCPLAGNTELSTWLLCFLCISLKMTPQSRLWTPQSPPLKDGHVCCYMCSDSPSAPCSWCSHCTSTSHTSHRTVGLCVVSVCAPSITTGGISLIQRKFVHLLLQVWSDFNQLFLCAVDTLVLRIKSCLHLKLILVLARNDR